PVAAHAAQDGSGSKGQHRRQAMAPALGAARIGYLPEKSGEGLHLRGSEHEGGTSDLKRWRKNSLGQQRAGVGPQGLDENHLGGLGRRAVAEASAVKSLRVPD